MGSCKLSILLQNGFAILNDLIDYILCILYALDQANTGARPDNLLVCHFVCNGLVVLVLNFLLDCIL